MNKETSDMMAVAIGAMTLQLARIADVLTGKLNTEDAPAPTKTKKAKAKKGEETNEEDDNSAEEKQVISAKVKAKPKASKKSASSKADADEEDDNEDSEESDAAPAKSEVKEKKKFKKKGTIYSRSNQIHKDLFAETLGDIAPGWSKDKKMAAKAKEASVELDGTDFLDADGQVLPTFVKALTKALK